MALQKTIEHQSGASSTYWKISYVITDYQFNRATIIMNGYTTEQARLDNKEPLEKRYTILLIQSLPLGMLRHS